MRETMDGSGLPAAACCCFWKMTTAGYCYKNTLGVKDSQVEQRGEAENRDSGSDHQRRIEGDFESYRAIRALEASTLSVRLRVSILKLTVSR